MQSVYGRSTLSALWSSWRKLLKSHRVHSLHTKHQLFRHEEGVRKSWIFCTQYRLFREFTSLCKESRPYPRKTLWFDFSIVCRLEKPLTKVYSCYWSFKARTTDDLHATGCKKFCGPSCIRFQTLVSWTEKFPATLPSRLIFEIQLQ